MRYKNIVFLAQIPPPSHGASLLNQRAKYVIGKYFNVFDIDYNFAREFDQLGKVSLIKIIKLITVLFYITKYRIRFGANLCYMSINVKGGAFIRDFLVAIYLRILGYKVIYHVHGLGVRENSKFIIFQCMYKLIFTNSIVICVSKIVSEKEFSGLGYTDKVFWATNGIDVPNISIKRSGRCMTICHMSNLRQKKGVLDALKVIYKLKVSDINVKLDIIGEFRDKTFKDECFEYINNHGIGDIVTFYGALYGDDKYKILSQCDIFLYPTYDDSFGLVMVEAMSVGALVCTYDEGSALEIVGNNKLYGAIVRKGDVSSLIDECLLICQYRDRYANKAMCRDYVISNFSTDRFETELTTILCNEV